MRSILLHEGARKVSDRKSALFLRFGSLSRRQYCRIPTNLYSLGRTELIGLHELLSIVSWTISLENQPCSRRRFSQGTPRCSYSRKSKTWCRKVTCRPEGFKDRTIFMSMYNDIDLGRKGNEENCPQNSFCVAAYAARFPKGHWSFLGPGSEENSFVSPAYKLDGPWNRVAEDMMIFVAESGHTVLRATSPSSRGALKKAQEVEERRKTTTRPRRRQSFYKAASCPFISSVSTEPQRIGVKILLSESQLILHVAQEIQLQLWTTTQSFKSRPRTYRTLPNHPCSMWRPGETRCSSTKRNSKTFQKIFN